MAAGFAFPLACTLCAVAHASGLVPLEAAHVCGLLMWPGFAITDRWSEPIGHPVAAWSLGLAVDTLIYSALLWFFLKLLRFILGRRRLQG